MTETHRHLVVDGSNIATEGRTLPSLAQLEDAVNAVSAQRGFDQITVIVDATFGHRIPKTESQKFEKRLSEGKMLTPPAGVVGRGDAFILEVANRAKATVLSNDSFQEFHGEYSWLFEEERLIGGKPVPGVGWVFVDRMPVRGPASRKATAQKTKKESKSAAKKTRRAEESQPKKTRRAEESQPKKTRRAEESQPKKTRRAEESQPKKLEAPEKSKPDNSKKMKKSKKSAESSDEKKVEELNSTTAFLAFVTKFSIGDVFDATVERFASHGCYVQAATAQCYLPSKSMGDPPPAKARDVVSRGDVVRVRVVSLDSARRGINVELVSVARVAGNNQQAKSTKSSPRRSNDSTGDFHLTRSERHVATKKAAKKAPAKKTTARKTTAKRAPAKKTTARKTTAKKAPAKKTAAKKTTARKTTAKKAPAKKTTSKKK